jgi:hypothetical protein
MKKKEESQTEFTPDEGDFENELEFRNEGGLKEREMNDVNEFDDEDEEKEINEEDDLSSEPSRQLDKDGYLKKKPNTTPMRLYPSDERSEKLKQIQEGINEMKILKENEIIMQKRNQDDGKKGGGNRLHNLNTKRMKGEIKSRKEEVEQSEYSECNFQPQINQVSADIAKRIFDRTNNKIDVYYILHSFLLEGSLSGF